MFADPVPKPKIDIGRIENPVDESLSQVRDSRNSFSIRSARKTSVDQRRLAEQELNAIENEMLL